MASGSESGATFVLKNSSGGTVFGPAAIGANLGSWSGSYPDVYPLDFDSFTAGGTYSISVSGPIAALSPDFNIDSPANLYTTPLSNTLFFYQNERDGPNFVATALRTAAGHRNDASAKVYITPPMNTNGRFSGDLTPATLNGSQDLINSAGGWWDAGDYMKFVETHSYTVGMMLVGIRDFPNEMGATGVTQNGLHFPDEAKFGLDWLQEMWDDTNQILYYQMAIASPPTRISVCSPLSTSLIWPIRIPAETCLPQPPSASIRRRNGAMTWSGARQSLLCPAGGQLAQWVASHRSQLLPPASSALGQSIHHWPQ